MSASVTSGQIYELRSIANTSIGLAVSSASTTDGENIIRYTVNDGNEFKWTVENTGSGWHITNVNSSKLMVVYNANFANGERLVQFSGGSANALWNIVQDGTKTINDTECPKVRIYAANSTEWAVTYNSNGNAVIATPSASDTLQQWALYPTWAADTSIPAPYSLGASFAVGSYENGGNVQDAAATVDYTVYPFWTCAPARADIAQFQYRYRTRTMAANSTWGAWGDWSSWGAANVTRDGQRFWLTSGLSVEVTSGKQAQAQFEVRDTSAVNGTTYVGATAQCSVMFYQRPVVNITSATWSPDGLRLGLTSNYSKGSTNVSISSIVANEKELLSDTVTGQLLTTSGAMLINQSVLKSIPADGTEITVTFKVGTDQMMLFPDTFTQTPGIAYDGGSVPVSLTFQEADGLALTCDLSAYDARLWVLVGNELTEMQTDEGVFTIYYPFGTPYTVFASGSDGTEWFAASATRTENASKVHALNWDGGFLLIEHNTDSPLTVDDSIEAVHNVYDLNSRPYQTVTYSPIRHQSLSPNGVLIDEFSTSTRDAVAEAVGKHATYRSPAGDLFPVAIISATRKTTSYWCEIQVSLIRESE